jgi:hypothetical protein
MDWHQADGEVGIINSYELITGKIIKPDAESINDFKGLRDQYRDIISGQPSEHEMLHRAFSL